MDLQQFNQIVIDHQDMIYHQAYRLLGDGPSAQDATQEAFLLAYRKFNGFRKGSLKAWLLRIVTNLCYDELRRRKRHPQIALEPVTTVGEEIESPVWLVDPADSPEIQAERAEHGHRIQTCLKSLPSEQCLALVLVDLQQLSYPEAAEVMGVSLGTVKSRLARGRQKMKKVFAGLD